MEIISRYGWVLLIAVTAGNAYIFKWRSKTIYRNKPELKKGYVQLFSALLLLFNIPWFIIGIGNLTGLSNNIFEYLNPGALHPIVLLFHSATILMLLSAAVWVYFKDGASFLVLHPGLLRKHGWGGKTFLTEKEVKLFMGIALLGCIAAMASLWIVHIPIPPLK